MIKFLKILPILICGYIYSQEETIKSIYFEFDKFDLDEIQVQMLLNHIKSIDSTQIETINIFGYCDDVGDEKYNLTLSNNRAKAINDRLIAEGIKNKIILTLEGKGKIALKQDQPVENLAKVRSKNRRVDILIRLRNLEELKTPSIYTSIENNHVVGDRIILENVLFERGSSKLNIKAKNELDKIVQLLQKHKNISFEIQGHVCCTPSSHKEAVDKDTKKRELSYNRAEAVYKYLVIKKISKNRMKYKGYGTSNPLKKGNEYDRRVELVITKI